MGMSRHNNQKSKDFPYMEMSGYKDQKEAYKNNSFYVVYHS